MRGRSLQTEPKRWSVGQKSHVPLIAQGRIRGDKEVSARYLLGSPGPLFSSHFDRATTNYTRLRGLEDVGCRTLEDIVDRMSDIWGRMSDVGWLVGWWVGWLDVGYVYMLCSDTPDTGGVGGFIES